MLPVWLFAVAPQDVPACGIVAFTPVSGIFPFVRPKLMFYFFCSFDLSVYICGPYLRPLILGPCLPKGGEICTR